MTLPVATRTVTIFRATGLDALDDFDAEPTYTPVARDVRAVIGNPGGSSRTERAEASTNQAALTMDPIPAGLSALDLIVDDTGTVWTVAWIQEVLGLGLDHLSAGLVRYEGEAPA
jgi:streptogramin lyase